MLITREDSRQGRLMAERQTNTDALAYAGYLGRVDAILDTRGYTLQSQDFAFNWHEAFVTGEEPAIAVDRAIDCGANWNKMVYDLARHCQISWYAAMADIEMRREANGDEEAARWFTRRLAGDKLAWGERA